MDTKKLRQKILDLAIHGKLVPQDPNDEPASVLLERIRLEKERLIKEGKIKRSRKTTKTSDATCDEQEVPFEVPNGWVWCRLGEVNDIARGGSPRPIKDYLTNSKNGVNWIKIGDTTKDGKYINSVKEKIRVEGVTKSRMVHKGDFLLTNSMSFGRPYILNVDGCIHDGWLVISPIGKVYSSDFLYYLLSSSFALNQFTQVASGGVVSNLNSDKVADTMFPIAPLAEQQRIVEEIERWFKLIDIIEQGKADLQTTIKQAKNKILDLAIHGKLVPQDPNDEPASELLKRINPKAEITCDNGHYKQLPYNWHWLKGKYIFSPMKSIKPSGEDFLYIDIESIDNKKQIINEVKNIKTANAPSRASRYTKKGDVVFSMVRPYLRNIAKIERDNCIASTGFFVCSPVKEILLSTYCYYLMISSYVVDGLNHFMKGDNSPSINKKDIDEWLFPIPPIAEQLRIVDKIEKLLLPLSEIQKP